MTAASATQSPLSDLATTGVQVPIGPLLVQVRSDLPQVDRHLRSLYADFPITSGAGGHFNVTIAQTPGVRRFVRPQANIAVNGVAPFLPLPAAISGGAFEWTLNWCIGRHAHQRVAVHAAVVEKDGRALILSGPSGSSKSTLCAALVLEDWRLFSDEFALIDPVNGLLFPLPRPIALKDAAIGIIRGRKAGVVYGPEGHNVEGERFAHMKPPAESVHRSREQASPACVVVPRWIAGSPARLEPLTKARALIHLTDQSFNYNYLGVNGYQCLVDVVRRSTCYTLEYGELDDALAILRNAIQD